jgi:myo-inositol-1(or 4)-monophosphatase
LNQPILPQLEEFAREAGAVLRAGFGKDHQVDRKGRIDLVTEMDRRAENLLISQIQSSFPGHTILTEETGELQGLTGHTWYIDPLDGTTNYAHNMPIFAVSIAYARAGKVELGVVYDPMRDECFSAERGAGARLNGQPIQVGASQGLLQSLLTTGFAYDIDYTEKNLVSFAHFSRLSQGVRRLGAAALDLCYVASGRVDGYWEQTLEAWDLAAGALIAEEAGAVVTSLEGDPNYIQPPYSILAANPVIHPQMLAEFQKMRA